jgi:hypothetical protein
MNISNKKENNKKIKERPNLLYSYLFPFCQNQENASLLVRRYFRDEMRRLLRGSHKTAKLLVRLDQVSCITALDMIVSTFVTQL